MHGQIQNRVIPVKAILEEKDGVKRSVYSVH